MFILILTVVKHYLVVAQNVLVLSSFLAKKKSSWQREAQGLSSDSFRSPGFYSLKREAV